MQVLKLRKSLEYKKKHQNLEEASIWPEIFSWINFMTEIIDNVAKQV